MTSEREGLLEKLLVSLHLSVPERQMLGSASISVDEVAAVVKRLLDRNGVFPAQARTTARNPRSHLRSHCLGGKLH